MSKPELFSNRVRWHVEGATGWIILSHPRKLNALNRTAWQDIARALRWADGQKHVRAVVLTGEGRAFCTGDDLQELRGLLLSGDVAGLQELFLAGIFGAVQAMLSSAKPVIAAVNGAAYGGGFELVLLSDLVVASESATFGQTEVRIGAWPPITAVFGRSVLAPKLVNELVLTGRVLTAAEAAGGGLVNAVVQDEDLKARVTSLAEEIGCGADAAVQTIKKIQFAQATALLAELEEAFKKMVFDTCSSPDFLEGVSAFAEKRKPRFS